MVGSGGTTKKEKICHRSFHISHLPFKYKQLTTSFFFPQIAGWVEQMTNDKRQMIDDKSFFPGSAD
jgi:hypothetical protein